VNPPHPTASGRHFAPRDVAQSPFPSLTLAVRFLPKRLGPGSSSLDALIEENSPLTSQPQLNRTAVHRQTEQLQCRFAVASAVISRAHSKVKQRMELRVIFLIFSFAAAISWLRTACREALGQGGGILPRKERDNFSGRSLAGNSRALAQRGRLPMVALPVRQTFRWESHPTR